MNQYKNKTIFCFAPLTTLLLLSLFAFTITASATVTPTIDLKASSDTGVSDTDDATNDDTPTLTVAGFPDDALITITATHSRAPHRTVTRIGNGDVTLPTLTDPTLHQYYDYDWSVTATDGTITAPHITIKAVIHKPRIDNIRSIGITTDTTPDLTFLASSTGMLVANSACGITAQEVGLEGSYRSQKWHTITLTELTPGTYASCTIQMIDGAGNTGTVARIPVFIIYTTPTPINAKEKITPIAPEPVISDPILPSVETTTDTLSVDTPTSEEEVTPTEEIETPTINIDASDTSYSDPNHFTSSDNTPTFTISGFDNGAQIRVYARNATRDDVTATRNSNGEVTLPTLADGLWRVRVSGRVGNTGRDTYTTTLVTIDTTGKVKTPTIDLVWWVDTGVSNADNITGNLHSYERNYNDTLVFSLSGFADDATVEVRASHATESDMTATRTGNGLVQLSEPADGVWSVTATDGTNTTDALLVTVDTVSPVVSITSSIGTTTDRTPTFTFTSSEAGRVMEVGWCRVPPIEVTKGENTITLYGLPGLGTYDCPLKVRDIAGNIRSLTIPLFTIKTIITPEIDICLSSMSSSEYHVKAGENIKVNLAKHSKNFKKYCSGYIFSAQIVSLHGANTIPPQTFSHRDYSPSEHAFTIRTERIKGGDKTSTAPVFRGYLRLTAMNRENYDAESMLIAYLHTYNSVPTCNIKTEKIKTHRLLVGITEKVNLSDHFSSGDFSSGDFCSLTYTIKTTTDKVTAEVKGGDKLLLTANKQDIGGNKVTITAQGANSTMTQTFRVKAYNLPAVDTLTDKQRFIVRKITEHNSKNNYLLVTFWRRAFFDLVGKKEVKIKRAKTEKGTKEYKSLSTLLWHLKQ